MSETENIRKESRTYRGIPASPGIAVGGGFVVNRGTVSVPLVKITQNQVESEIDRLKKALDEARSQVAAVRQRVEGLEVKEPQYILDTHLLILDDEMLLRDSCDAIRDDLVNAEWGLHRTIGKIKRALADVEDDYFRERVSDVDQVGERIQRVLLGREDKSAWHAAVHGRVVVANDLSPADTAQMHKEQVLGFVTELGGRTSHTSIMARSLEIPAVVGLGEVVAEVISGQDVIIDGYKGLLIVNPTAEQIGEYQRLKIHSQVREERLRAESTKPAVTLDGVNVSVAANIDLLEEVEVVQAVGADGVGMFRTEYLFMNRSDLPDEEEQFQIYKDLVKKIQPKPVTIRTLDVGGDKLASPVDAGGQDEANPALGLRAIRYGLQKPEIFRAQLRAIVRASAFGPVRILFPLISGLDEVRRAKEHFVQVKRELLKEGVECAESIELGVMIEVPAAAIITDLIAEEVDFLSIGTNDLIQYCLAIDRVNENVAYLYEPLHPAMLRIIHSVLVAAHKKGKRVSMCGEMAGETDCLLVLIGLGLLDLSMNATSIPRVKRFLRVTSTKEAKEIAQRALQFSTAKEVRDYVADVTRDREPRTEG